jgi:hypothetical protein
MPVHAPCKDSQPPCPLCQSTRLSDSNSQPAHATGAFIPSKTCVRAQPAGQVRVAAETCTDGCLQQLHEVHCRAKPTSSSGRAPTERTSGPTATAVCIDGTITAPAASQAPPNNIMLQPPAAVHSPAAVAAHCNVLNPPKKTAYVLGCHPINLTSRMPGFSPCAAAQAHLGREAGTARQ